MHNTLAFAAVCPQSAGRSRRGKACSKERCMTPWCAAAKPYLVYGASLGWPFGAGFPACLGKAPFRTQNQN